MIAEMGIQSLSSVTADLDRIRMAEKIKGMQWGVHSLVPAGLILVHGALEQGRGYCRTACSPGISVWGDHVPENFLHEPLDIVAGFLRHGSFIYCLDTS